MRNMIKDNLKDICYTNFNVHKNNNKLSSKYNW